jgi:hypothetical protein
MRRRRRNEKKEKRKKVRKQTNKHSSTHTHTHTHTPTHTHTREHEHEHTQTFVIHQARKKVDQPSLSASTRSGDVDVHRRAKLAKGFPTLVHVFLLLF